MRITLEAAPSPSHVAIPPCRTLREYIVGLVQRLAEHEGALHDRLREVVGERSARIRLDDETVLVRFERDALRVIDADPGVHADGLGGTDRATTLDLLAGRVDVGDAILDGHLDAAGDIEDLARIFQAIEILLVGATCIPTLQHLALEYRTDPCRPLRAPIPDGTYWRPRPLDADVSPPAELAILRRLDLLP